MRNGGQLSKIKILNPIWLYNPINQYPRVLKRHLFILDTSDKKTRRRNGKKNKKKTKENREISKFWMIKAADICQASNRIPTEKRYHTDRWSKQSVKTNGCWVFYPLQTKKSDILLSVVKGLWNKKWKSTSNKHWLTSKKNPDWHRGDGRK